MPAINPRISVTVTPSVEAVLSRLSVATGQSKSSFIAELLESSMPVFERMATVIEAAKQAKDTLKSQTIKDMEEAESRLHEILGVTRDIFDQSTAPIIKEAERVQRRTRGARSGAGDVPARSASEDGNGAGAATQPPYVTRGSGTPKPGKRAPKTAKRAEAKEQGQSDEVEGSPKKSLANGSKRAVAASKRKVKG
jgi:hypothetical protein